MDLAHAHVQIKYNTPLHLPPSSVTTPPLPINPAPCTAALFLNAVAHNPRMVRCTTFSPLPPPPCLVCRTAASHLTTPPDALQRTPQYSHTAAHPPTTPPDALPYSLKMPRPHWRATCHAECCLPSSPLPPPPSPQVDCQVPSL